MTAHCIVSGTTAPEVQQDGGAKENVRDPDGNAKEEGRVEVQVAAAAAAAGEVVKHQHPGNGKEEEAVAARARQVSRLHGPPK